MLNKSTTWLFALEGDGVSATVVAGETLFLVAAADFPAGETKDPVEAVAISNKEIGGGADAAMLLFLRPMVDGLKQERSMWVVSQQAK